MDGDAPAIDYAVGIDLGTTNSVISVYRNGKLEVVLDKKGRNLTPSVVAYRDEDILVGYKALEQYADNPKNTITEVKRLMGRNYDKQVQEDAQHWPFTVINKDGEPRIQVEYRAETRQFRPEQVSSTILRKLFSLATQHLGVVVKSLDAVVTVPVYFGDSERNATVSACGIGGINVTRMITEPSAAALAYTLQTEESSPSRVLVFDMGGGTTDVSLLRVSEGHDLQVLACHGDNHLGGEDLDRLIVEQCLGHLYEKHRVRLTDKNLGPKTRLRLAVEKAKRELSGASQAHIKLQQIVTQVDFHYEITRKTFEALVASEFQKAVKLVEKCLEEAKMSPLDVSKVILAGGSTYIPRLQEMLSEVLPGVPLYSSVSQEVAVACGAALQAAKDLNIITQDFSLSEILPWSLSTDVEGGRSYVLLPKNTKIPAKAIKTFSTTQDFQKSIPIEIYEGESEFCKDNKLLGSMILTDIRPALKGLVKVRVGFSIDENGILQAAAKEKNSENKVSVKIERYKKEITEKQIECLKSTAEEEFDYGRVMELCRQMDKLKSATKSDSSLPEMQRKCIKKQCDEMHAWAKSHPNPELGCFDGLLHDLRNKLKTLGLNVTLDDNGKMTFNDKDL